jgi:hypothetical protein
MAAVIVVGSLVLAGVYAWLWWSRPDLRRRIETPGRRFAADAKRYDRATAAASNIEGRDHGDGESKR